MRNPNVARAFLGITGLVALAGLLVQLPVTARLQGTQFTNVAARVVNMFCYFTVQSNVLVALTCLMLAVRLDRRSTLFRVLRLCAVLGITLTFVVFHLALSGLQELHGSAAVADFLLHTASPILCIIGWLVFGPRGLVDRGIVLWSIAFPGLYAVLTIIRGAAIDWYPYPFMDVTAHGYGQVAINSVVVAVVFVALASGAYVLDGLLDRRPEPATV